jgi:hypothetical protein
VGGGINDIPHGDQPAKCLANITLGTDRSFIELLADAFEIAVI